MGPYSRDGQSRSRNEREQDYQRRDQNRDDEEFHFRGASNRERGHRENYSRDRHTRQYRDRDFADDRRNQQPYSSSSDHRYGGGGWSDRDYVIREPTPPPQRPNGDDNIASQSAPPSQVLLIRRLKTSSNPQVLIKGLNKKLCRDSEGSGDNDTLGATSGSLRGIYFICDRSDDTCLSFAFAEFHSVADAKSALQKSLELGDLCTVSSQRFLVDYANFNAFPVADNRQHPDFVFQLAEDIPVKLHRMYRDPLYYASFEPVNIDPPEGYQVRTEEDVATNTKPSSSLPLPSTSSSSMKFSLNKRSNESPAIDKSGEPKAKKYKTEGKLGPSFDTWNRKRAELRKDVEESDSDLSDSAAPKQSFLCKVIVSRPNKDSTDSSLTKEDHANESELAICFLCETRLSVRHAQAHALECRKHQDSLQDTARLNKAYALMRKLNLQPEGTIPLALPKPESKYVDRAKLRRRQEKRERKELREMAKAEPAFKMSLNSGKEENLTSGLGASMLKKQGWTEGAGLGSGAGRTAPIEQNMFAAGVGLGHKDSAQGDALEHAGRVTRGEAGSFVDKTKETARQRFHDMNRD